MTRQHGCRAVGITLCRRQASRGRRIAAEHGVSERTEFLVTDFNETSFPDESFTKIFASESVCYALRKLDFLREAHRLLRSGGRLVVVDGYQVDRELSDRERETLGTWAEGWAVPGLARLDEFASDLRVAGFREIAFHDQTQQVLPSARRILLRGLSAWPIARAACAAGLLSEGQLAHVRSSIKQYAIWQRSAIHGIFSASK
jgi:cyclopropane fatty-acyl-phospholipid synthase-like methyltransferase